MEDNLSEMPNILSPQKLKMKRKRDRLFYKIDSLVYVPREYKKIYTEAFMEESPYSSLLFDKKGKTNPAGMNFSTSLIDKKQPSDVNIFNNQKQIDERIPIIKEEIEEIVSELEIFEIQNRKRKMIHIMEHIADCIDDDLIDVDEMFDFFFFGDKVNSIEKEFLENQKRKYKNDYNLCEITNKMLNDDNEVYQESKKNKENTFIIKRSNCKKK